MSSWIWGTDDTVDQANLVVQSLQSELDERQATIEVLERALRREKQQHLQDLQDEVEELRQRRQALAREMMEIDVLLASKEAFLNGTLEKKPRSSKKTKAREQPSPPEVQPESVPSPAPEERVEEPQVEPQEEDEPEPLPCNPELTKVRGVDPSTAFIIQRSNNANTVVYKGNVINTTLDPKAPLHIYWIMYALQGPPYPTEELNMIERNTAYGASCTAIGNNQFEVALASLKDRSIILFFDGSVVRAKTTINGQRDVYLERVYVQSTTSWGLPKVEYVEIFGVDPTTKQIVYEKKLP